MLSRLGGFLSLTAVMAPSWMSNSPWHDGQLRREETITVCMDVKTISMLQIGQIKTSSQNSNMVGRTLNRNKKGCGFHRFLRTRQTCQSLANKKGLPEQVRGVFIRTHQLSIRLTLQMPPRRQQRLCPILCLPAIPTTYDELRCEC